MTVSGAKAWCWESRLHQTQDSTLSAWQRGRRLSRSIEGDNMTIWAETAHFCWMYDIKIEHIRVCSTLSLWTISGKQVNDVMCAFTGAPTIHVNKAHALLDHPGKKVARLTAITLCWELVCDAKKCEKHVPLLRQNKKVFNNQASTLNLRHWLKGCSSICIVPAMESMASRNDREWWSRKQQRY